MMRDRLVALALLCGGCLVPDRGPPARPASVPEGAFWCGGADGGVFVQVYRSTKGGGYQGAIYTDHGGDVLFRGRFRADPANPGPAPRRGRAWCGGWDGTRLYLQPRGALIAIDADKQIFAPK